jgi:signal transduction histidine kinase
MSRHVPWRRPGKTTRFLGLYAVLIAILALAVGLSSAWLERRLSVFWWIIPTVLFALLALAAPLLYVGILRVEERLLREQRRYHRTLIAASSQMTRIKGVQQLCRLIVRMVNRTVGLANASAFLYEPEEQRYAVRAVRYPSLFPIELSVSQDDPLVQLLQETQDLITLEELQETVERKSSPERSRAAHVYEWMRRLEARLIVPSFSSDRLLAFLVLGPKRSEEPYTTDDIAVFSGLANQAALAIENALFFEELQTNEAYMIQSEKLASLGQLASGMAHEIHNPLTIISGESQLYLERFRGQDARVDALLLSVIEECKRAADITRRILRFAKPAPPDVTAVDVKATIEESLTLAGYQVRLERVERVVEVPDALPKVRSNQNQLQEVLLNLILNACQAMGEKGGRLALSAHPNGSTVVLKVEDNGPGIPAGALRKVFDPFYTTKASGTGLGLFVTQRIVKSHGGTIELESAEGKGTCFTVRLPVWEEGAATVVQPAGSAEAPAPGGGPER